MDALPSLLLGRILCHWRRFGLPPRPDAPEGMMPPLVDTLPHDSGRCFAAVLLERILCRRSLFLFSVDALPPPLHFVCWQPCVDVFILCRFSRLGLWWIACPYRLSFYFVIV